MRILEFSSSGFWPALRRFCRNSAVPAAVQQSVAQILSDIETGGDRAVSHYIEKFDGARLAPSEFRVSAAEIKAAARRLPAADRSAIRAAIKSVREFNQQCLPKPWRRRNSQGARIGEAFYPLKRVGIYIPSGLASTVVMTTVLARVARVPEIALFTPGDSNGQVSDAVLAAAHLCGISEIYGIGGVQAIGAMAFGTRTIPPVVKIFGPGNAFVVEAKRQVFGQVGVDLLPGPSEVMVVTDDSADAEFVATDLLAQAEHGSGRERVFLVTTSRRFLEAIHGRLKSETARLGPKAPASRVLARSFLSVVVPDLDAAAQVADWVAPEHLELEVPGPAQKQLLSKITTAGAALLGGWSATALGDFTAGPSHELPTGRAGRFSSGLQVTDFLRRTSVVEYDEAALRRAAPVVEAFSRMEKLEAHGRSVAVRVARQAAKN